MRRSRVVAAALLFTACQPWYRDRENLGRYAHDEARTRRELAQATAEHERGNFQQAAAIMRSLVGRDPDTQPETWLVLGQFEIDAGRGVEGRAYLRWKLEHLTAGDLVEPRLRALLVTSLVADGLEARALDLVRPQTLHGALAFDALARPLRELGAALDVVRTNPDIALGHAIAWLDAYGVPDHAILEAAHQELVTAVWSAAMAPKAPASLAALRRLGPHARDELRRGHLTTALAIYAQATRLVPAKELEPLRAEIEQAASTRDPAILDPVAHAFALEGDAMVRTGKFGAAIQAYRRAVASAPWWKSARTNLTALLEVDR